MVVVAPAVVKLVAVDGWPCGEIGGDPAALVRNSACGAWNDGGFEAADTAL